jgi:LuxR family transcriptional regulator, maltose regulon positive regulatory protein
LGWQRHLVNFQMKAAVVDFRSGNMGAVQRAVPDALRRGMRLGLVRSLLDADPAALDVITRVMQGEPHDPVLSFYMNRLQAAHAAFADRPATANVPANGRSGVGYGTETLSERESRVVNLLAKALPNKKIARTLGISPETVKWHLKNIYGKLGVSSRDEAVARVRDLMLDSESDTGMPDGLG